MRITDSAHVLWAALLATVFAASAVGVENPALATDWPQFLGPGRTGVSPERGLLRKWPEGGPKVLWRAPIDVGWSSPSVVGDNVYIIMTKWVRWNEAWEIVKCLDAATGRERWSHKYYAKKYYCGWRKGGVRASPTVTDKAVYTMGMLGHLTCTDRRTGAVVWQRDVDKEYERSHSDWKGWNQSPVASDGVVAFTVDRCRTDKSSSCVGLDAATGKELWNYDIPDLPKSVKARPPDVGYPAPAKYQGEDCVLFVGQQTLHILRMKDGKVLFRDRHRTRGRKGSFVMQVAPTTFIDMPGMAGLFGVEIAGGKAKQLWYTHIPPSWYLPPYRYGDHLYGFFSKKEYNPTDIPGTVLELNCVDMKTGKRVWSEPNFRHGVSLIIADGLIFARSYQTLRLVEATPKGYVELGKVTVHAEPNKGSHGPPGLGDWTTPALSRGRLYIRTPKELICYDVADHEARKRMAGRARSRPARRTGAAVPRRAEKPVASKAEKLYGLGLQMEKARQGEAAAGIYERVVREFPEDPAAKKARGRLEEMKRG